MDRYIYLTKTYEDISNVDSFDNAEQVISKYLKLSSNDNEKKLIKSLLNKNKYNKIIPLKEFMEYITILETTDIEKGGYIANLIKRNTTDKSQINTLERILKIKNWEINKDDKNIIKSCPHCGYKMKGNEWTDYVICGYYESSGYNLKGCGFDWCFKCQKKLCKFWEFNNLCDEYNRFHNSTCCKSYANHTDDIYPDDFCQCSNNHVFRDNIYHNAISYK